MTEQTRVEIRFDAIDETDRHGPDSRVVHRFRITPLDPDGSAPPPGPCGVVTATLDHGVTIEADPMRTAGLVGATVEIAGETVATVGRHFADPDLPADDRAGGGELSEPAATLLHDLFGPEVVAAITDRSRLRNVGDEVRGAADDRRWDLARQLAWCEAEADRAGSPTAIAPSLWAADAVRLGQRLSPALSDWAIPRADQAAPALAILPPAGALHALAPVWPVVSELAAVVRSLAGRSALDDLAALFDHEPPDVGDWETAFSELALRSETETDLAFMGGLAFRGSVGERAGDASRDVPILMGGERAVELPTVLLGAVSDLVDPSSVSAEWRAGDGVIEVRASLSKTGAAMASQPGGKELIAEELAAVCAFADTGEVVADRGVVVADRLLGATLPLRVAPTTGDRFEVRIHRRGLDDRRSRDDRRIGVAVDAAREALRLTHQAFSGAQPDPAPDRRAAADQWSVAGSQWKDAGRPEFAEHCRRLAQACQELATSDRDPGDLLGAEVDLPSTLAVDRVAPGLRLVLEDHADRLREALEAADVPAGEGPSSRVLDEAHTYVALARTLGLPEASTEIAVEAVEATRRLGLPVDEDDLAEVVWRALVLTRRDDLVRDAARLLASSDLELDDD